MLVRVYCPFNGPVSETNCHPYRYFLGSSTTSNGHLLFPSNLPPDHHYYCKSRSSTPLSCRQHLRISFISPRTSSPSRQREGDSFFSPFLPDFLLKSTDICWQRHGLPREARDRRRELSQSIQFIPSYCTRGSNETVGICKKGNARAYPAPTTRV